MPAEYKIFITPLVQEDVYGDVVDESKDVDITDFVKRGGMGAISREIDNQAYETGVFNYGSIRLKLINFTRKFNDENYPESIFPFSRDRAKVDVIYISDSAVETIIFKGLINEEATRQDENVVSDDKAGTVSLRVLSQDSIFRKANIKGGTVSIGMDFDTAFQAILNTPFITNVIGFDAAKINADFNGTVDNAEFFSNIPVREGLNALLKAANSVLLIDDNNDMAVRSREENSNTPHEFYGAGNLEGKENIIKMKSYNTGLQRTFNSVTVNGKNRSSGKHISRYGLRFKEDNFDFITNEETAQDIAQKILTEFWFPREEVELEFPTEKVEDVRLLDKAKVFYPYRLKPARNSTIPVYGQVVADGSSLFPHVSGSFKIEGNLIWKVIKISRNVRNLRTTLRLRRTGNVLSSGVT